MSLTSGTPLSETPLSGTLTAGTTLQGNLYIIQTLLHRSDFGAIYQAFCTLTKRAVVLQTFDRTLQQRSDFAQLQERFLTSINDLIDRQPDLQILDCFQENEIPFLVLELHRGQTPSGLVARLGDWLTIPPESGLPELATAVSAPSNSQAPPEFEQLSLPLDTSPVSPDVLSAHVLVTPNATDPQVTIAPEPLPDPLPEPLQAAPAPDLPKAAPTLHSVKLLTPPTLSPPHPLTPPPRHPAIQSTVKSTVTSTVKSSVKVLISNSSLPKVSFRSRSWLLPALLVTLMTGFAGLGAGLALRLRPMAETDSDRPTNSAITPPSFFSREQSFPSQADWPVTEVPNYFSTTPTIEEPLYRTIPPLDPLDPTEPQTIDPIAPYEPPVVSDPSLSPLPDRLRPVPSEVTPPIAPANPSINRATIPDITPSEKSAREAPVPLPPDPVEPITPDLPPPIQVAPPAPELPEVPSEPASRKPLSDNEPIIFRQ